MPEAARSLLNASGMSKAFFPVLLAGLLLATTFGTRVSAQGPDGTSTEARIEALERQLAELSAQLTQLKIVSRQAELEKEQAAERAKTASQPSAGRSGFSLQSADGQFRLRLRGYLHSDGRFFLDDGGQPAVDTFVLRRVRPIVEATMYDIFDFRVMPDFGAGATSLQDAYVEMRLRPQLKIRAGKFKPPLGFERLISATELSFIERALPTSLVPNRDLGVMVHGDVIHGNLAYAAGLFNGVADGGSADADLNDGKDLIGRVFLQPFRARRDSPWRGLGVGLAGSYGTQTGTSAASNALPTFRTSGQNAFFAFRGDDPVLGPVLADGTHTRISTQAHYYAGAFGLLGEHVLATQQVRRLANRLTVDNTSWQLAGSWVLTGETPSYRGVTPRARFDPGADTWGALELTARYSTLDVDRDVFPAFANPATAAQSASAWATGLNWYLNSGVKFQVNFERTTFGTAGTARRPAENDLLTRLQFAF